VQVALEAGPTVLLFLTTTCFGCRSLWDGLRAGETLDNARLVLVTPSLTTESGRDVAALAPEGTQVLMSTETWHAFGITAAPWFVVVTEGCVAAGGAAPAAWDQVRAQLSALSEPDRGGQQALPD
jgi:hypothetical protein